jgi:hypothetical protein
LAIVGPFVAGVSLQKQPSPKATMAASYFNVTPRTPLGGTRSLDDDDARTIARILGSEYVDVENPFDPGNVYKQIAPFTTVPA